MYDKIKVNREKEREERLKENPKVPNLPLNNEGVIIECNLLDNNSFNLEIR